ncbi:hypothetical protein G9A89_013327 [Geosiphon pyriformis]|nr:hypothetical protein G9A89_013327 [Geosiphon pyriformis]
MELRVLGEFLPFGSTFVHSNFDDSEELFEPRFGSSKARSVSGRTCNSPSYQLCPAHAEGQTCKGQSEDDLYEEELYIKDTLVVWSRGNLLKKSFNFETPVIQALFVWFNVDKSPTEEGSSINFTNPEIIKEKPIEKQRCLCVLLEDFGKVYYPDGKSHAFTLPFPVCRAWSLDLGLLLYCDFEEKWLFSRTSSSDSSVPSSDFPILYSLLDPLKEIKPVSIAGQIFHNDGEIALLGPINPFFNAHEEVIFVSQTITHGVPIICTVNRLTGERTAYSYGTKRGNSVVSEFEAPNRRSSGVRSDTTMNLDRFLHPEPQNFLSNEKRVVSESSVEVYLENLWSEKRSPSQNPNDITAFIAHEYDGGQVLGIFTRSTKSLIILSISFKDHRYKIFIKSQLSVSAAVPIAATRPKFLDILTLQTDGTIQLWIGSGKYLPITFPNYSDAVSGNKIGLLFSKKRTNFSQQNFSSTYSSEISSKKGEFSGSRAVDLKDSVYHRVNIVFSDDMVFRTSFNFMPCSSLVRSCLGAMSYALPMTEYLEFKARYLLYNFGQSEKFKEIPQTSQWDNFVVTLLSFFHPTSDDDINMPERDLNGSFLLDDEDEDWQALCATRHRSKIQFDTIYQAIAPSVSPGADRSLVNLYQNSKKLCNLLSSTSDFRNFLPSILFAIHLLYEDQKLSVISHKCLEDLLPLLLQLAKFLGWDSYLDYYARAYRALQTLELAPGYINIERLVFNKGLFVPPDIHQWILERIRTKGPIIPFPTFSDINRLFQIPQTSIHDFDCGARTLQISGFYNELFTNGPNSMILRLVHWNFKVKDIDALPFGIALPLREAIRSCRKRPPVNWPGEAYILIGREDLAELTFGNRITSTYFHSRRGLKMDQNPTDVHSIAQSVTPFENSTPNTNPNNLSVSGGANGGSSNTSNNNRANNTSNTNEKTATEITNHEISDLRFDRDRRLAEVQRLLQPSNVIKLSSSGTDPSGNESDISGRNLEWISAHCMKNFAQPVGRGILTYGTTTPIITEKFPIPGISTTVRILPSNTVRVLDRGLRSQEILDWPEFHDGAAAGLRITRDCKEVDGSWISLNKPNELDNSHAGFLLGLGLNGHLKTLGAWRAVDYLMKTPKHDMTSIALVIGLAASFCETMDTQTTKFVGVHVPALLPPKSTSLNVSALTQTAAVLGIGLLYLGTCHRRMAQVMLGEIGGKSLITAENTEIDYREGYSLAAGLALGFITLGRGFDAPGLADLDIFKELRLLITGSKGRTQTAPLHPTGCGGSRPGDININTTSLGATIALGLMFLKTNNASVADKIPLPETAYFLDFVRPDFLAIRVLSKNLIMWDSIQCSVTWVEEHIPGFIKSKLEKNINDDSIESIKQSYYYMLAGACFSIALKFAGSSDEDALKCLLHFLDFFMARVSARGMESHSKEFYTFFSNWHILYYRIFFIAITFDQRITHQTVKTCVNVLSTSASIVMAGTGNLEVLRRLRKLHRPEINHVISRNYGSHMATSMALGFLFVGGGTWTVATSDKAIAALVCSLFPRWPTDPTDNRTHMQAFRHLWVLALESRCLIIRDVETREACHVPIKVITDRVDRAIYDKTMSQSSFKVSSMVAPCLLPESKFLVRIEIESPRYWPIILDLRNNKRLSNRFWLNPTIFVKRKTGHLSYAEDPQSIWSLNSRLFPRKTPSSQSNKRKKTKWEFVKVFSSDPQVLAFTSHLCKDEMDRDLAAFCTGVLQECLISDKPEAIQTYLSLYQSQQNPRLISFPTLWNIKLILAYYEHASNPMSEEETLIQPVFITSIRQQMDQFFESLFERISGASSEARIEEVPLVRLLRNYFQKLKFPTVEELKETKASTELLTQLANFLVYNDVPEPGTLRVISNLIQNSRRNIENDSLMSENDLYMDNYIFNILLTFLPHLSIKTIRAIAQLL